MLQKSHKHYHDIHDLNILKPRKTNLLESDKSGIRIVFLRRVPGWWFRTFFYWDFIIPTDEVIFFRGVGIPPTRFLRRLKKTLLILTDAFNILLTVTKPATRSSYSHSVPGGQHPKPLHLGAGYVASDAAELLLRAAVLPPQP
jgi:hypothetical protein